MRTDANSVRIGSHLNFQNIFLVQSNKLLDQSKKFLEHFNNEKKSQRIKEIVKKILDVRKTFLFVTLTSKYFSSKGFNDETRITLVPEVCFRHIYKYPPCPHSHQLAQEYRGFLGLDRIQDIGYRTKCPVSYIVSSNIDHRNRHRMQDT